MAYQGMCTIVLYKANTVYEMFELKLHLDQWFCLDSKYDSFSVSFTLAFYRFWCSINRLFTMSKNCNVYFHTDSHSSLLTLKNISKKGKEKRNTRLHTAHSDELRFWMKVVTSFCLFHSSASIPTFILFANSFLLSSYDTILST